jgi:hypothetical protein
MKNGDHGGFRRLPIKQVSRLPAVYELQMHDEENVAANRGSPVPRR